MSGNTPKNTTLHGIPHKMFKSSLYITTAPLFPASFKSKSTAIAPSAIIFIFVQHTHATATQQHVLVTMPHCY